MWLYHFRTDQENRSAMKKMILLCMVMILCCIGIAESQTTVISVACGSANINKMVRIELALWGTVDNLQWFSVAPYRTLKEPWLFYTTTAYNSVVVQVDVKTTNDGTVYIIVNSPSPFNYSATMVPFESSDLDKQLSFLLGGMVALAFSITFAQRL